MISQAVGCQHTRLSGLGERHFDGFASLVRNIQDNDGWVKGFFCGFPGCRLPTYRARRVG